MKNIGDFIVNRKQVCQIDDIVTKNDCVYYVLAPVEDKSLKLRVPVDAASLRDTITLEALETLIKEIPTIDTIQNNDKLIENEYKALMSRGTHEDLIKVIKTTFLRNKKRRDDNKKISDRDDEYFKQAEKYLYNELSVVLGLTYDETKRYVLDMVDKLQK